MRRRAFTVAELREIASDRGTELYLRGGQGCIVGDLAAYVLRLRLALMRVHNQISDSGPYQFRHEIAALGIIDRALGGKGKAKRG